MPKLSAVFKLMRLTVCALIWCTDILSCRGISTTLSPLGMVSVCPGGQLVLTCETTSSLFLYWTVSFPHLAVAPERIVPDQGDITSPRFNIGFTEFSITRISQNPLVTQLLIVNVTTGINGSNIYCSVDGNENNAPMVTVHITEPTTTIRNPPNVDTVAHLSTSDVTVLLILTRENGSLFNASIIPPVHTPIIYYSSNIIQLTLLYNIEYNVTVKVQFLASLCGQTGEYMYTLIRLKYINCGYPILDSTISTNFSHPATQGVSIFFSCSNDLVLTGPDSATCMDSGQWEPDPREVKCKANCGPIVPPENGYVNNYTSTLEDTNVTLMCEKNLIDSQIFVVARCNANGNWDPNPFKLCMDTYGSSGNTLLIILIPSIVVATTLITLFVINFCICAIIRAHMTKKTTEDHIQQPVYEEVTHKGVLMEENTAYGQFKCNL